MLNADFRTGPYITAEPEIKILARDSEDDEFIVLGMEVKILLPLHFSPDIFTRVIVKIPTQNNPERRLGGFYTPSLSAAPPESAT